MAAFLLDTHTLLWYVDPSDQLSEQAFQLITNADHTLGRIDQSVSGTGYWVRSGSQHVGCLFSIMRLCAYLSMGNISPLSLLLANRRER